MKYPIVLMFWGALLIHTQAQNIEKEVELPDVEIKAAKVVIKPDGKLLFPTEYQKSASSSGYNLLNKLSLPGIRIDDINYTVSSINNRGGVQLRINGITVSKSDMLSLETKDVKSIDFIENPGVRYGEGIAYVINIITKRNDSGMIMGMNLTQTLTTERGDDMVYAKINRGKSQLSISYDFNYNDKTGDRKVESANYLLNDGKTYNIQRNDFDSRSRYYSNSLDLKYNIADSTKYMFQASLSGNITNIPGNHNKKEIIEDGKTSIATEWSKSKSSAPVLDLYYFNQLNASQSLTLNAVGTYISTNSQQSYDEGDMYKYRVDGETSSLMSEAIYENKLRPFTLSAGINYMLKYTANEYIGDVNSNDPMHSSQLYGFSEIRGTLKSIRYKAGIGVSNLKYSQSGHRYNFWLFRPKASLSYSPTNNIQISYDFEINEHISRIVMISNTTIRSNSMEWTKGNPDINPNKETIHTLNMSYNNQRFNSYINIFYKNCHKPSMALYERTDNNQFIYSQVNQKSIGAIDALAYVNYWLIPEKLSIGADGSIFRCLNFGNEYTHCYTTYMYQLIANAYLGNFTISAYADNGNSFLEGESKGRNAAYTSISASYKHKSWTFSLTCQNLFNERPRLYNTEVINRYINKRTSLYSPDAGNVISLNVAWKISKGKRYNSLNKKINKRDSETGIM